jgi:hypothetical protein
MTWDDLPGGDLVREGLDDLRNGRETAPALLVAVGAPRLRRLGIAVPETVQDPEHRLYALLARTEGDGAHSRFNAPHPPSRELRAGRRIRRLTGESAGSAFIISISTPRRWPSSNVGIGRISPTSAR